MAYRLEANGVYIAWRGRPAGSEAQEPERYRAFVTKTVLVEGWKQLTRDMLIASFHTEGEAVSYCRQRDFEMKEDQQFDRQKRENEWPQDSCKFERCRSGSTCCKRVHHHNGNVCLHCGNDEREEEWRYR